MANTFNTRIQLKRDSLTNWNESSLVLKPGEVGVAYVDVATKDTQGNIIHVPTALLKVGENVEGSTKTFKDLPFVSALAADVYAWAKKEGIEVIDEGTGEVISDVAWDATKNALVLSRIDVVTPAELTEALGGYYTKTEIDNLLEGLSIGALEERIGAVEDTLEGYGDIVTHNVSEFATAEQGTKADNAATTIATYGDIVTHNISEFATAEQGGKADATAATIATYGDIVTHNASEFEAAGAANTVNEALESYKTTNNEALAGVKATAEAAATKEYTDAELAKKVNSTDYNADKATFATKDELNEVSERAEKGITDAAAAQKTADEAKTAINTFMGTIESDTEAVDTLKEVIDLINSGNDVATGLLKDVSDLKAADITLQGNIDKKADATTVEALDDRVEALEGKPAAGITSEQISNWDGEVGAKAAAAAAQKTADDYATAHANDYTNKQIDDAIDADIKTAIDAEVLRANGAYDAKGAAADAQAAAIADAAGKYETKGTAQGIVDGLKLAETYEPIGAEGRAIAAAKTETENQIAALNVTQYAKTADLHAVATSGNIADLEQTADTYILFDCGTSTLVV